MRTQDTIDIQSFGTDAINGYVPNLMRGSLGLKKQETMTSELNGAAAPAKAVNGVDEVKMNGTHQPEEVKAH